MTTAAQNVMTGIRDVTGTHMLDKGIDTNDQFLRATAPQSKTQQQNYSVGDQVTGLYMTKLIEAGLTGVQLVKNMKPLATLSKLADESPHIAAIIKAGLKSGTANAATTGVMGGSAGDVFNAGLTGAGLGAGWRNSQRTR